MLIGLFLLSVTAEALNCHILCYSQETILNKLGETVIKVGVLYPYTKM